MADDFRYTVFEDHPFDEKGSTFLSLRRLQWGADESEADPEKAKWELRRWRIREEKEMADKGFSFLTEDGPHELVSTMIDAGFGHTKDVMRKLSERDDFKESVESLWSDDSVMEGEYFDPRSILFGDEEAS